MVRRFLAKMAKLMVIVKADVSLRLACCALRAVPLFEFRSCRFCSNDFSYLAL